MFTFFASRLNGKNSTRLCFVSLSVRDRRGRLVSAAQIVYHSGLNSPFCLHTCRLILGNSVDSEAVESDLFFFSGNCPACGTCLFLNFGSNLVINLD